MKDHALASARESIYIVHYKKFCFINLGGFLSIYWAGKHQTTLATLANSHEMSFEQTVNLATLSHE